MQGPGHGICGGASNLSQKWERNILAKHWFSAFWACYVLVISEGMWTIRSRTSFFFHITLIVLDFCWAPLNVGGRNTCPKIPPWMRRCCLNYGYDFSTMLIWVRRFGLGPRKGGTWLSIWLLRVRNVLHIIASSTRTANHGQWRRHDWQVWNDTQGFRAGTPDFHKPELRTILVFNPRDWPYFSIISKTTK